MARVEAAFLMVTITSSYGVAYFYSATEREKAEVLHSIWHVDGTRTDAVDAVGLAPQGTIDEDMWVEEFWALGVSTVTSCIFALLIAVDAVTLPSFGLTSIVACGLTCGAIAVRRYMSRITPLPRFQKALSRAFSRTNSLPQA